MKRRVRKAKAEAWSRPRRAKIAPLPQSRTNSVVEAQAPQKVLSKRMKNHLSKWQQAPSPALAQEGRNRGGWG